MSNTVSRRDMLKTTSLTGLFAISPLAFQTEQPKINLDKSKDQNVFFGRNIKRLFNDTNFKPWLKNCNNLRMETTWENSWKFKQGELDFPNCTPPETILRLNYPNYSLEFKSMDKTWYGSSKPHRKQLPPINGIHILYNPPIRMGEQSLEYIELNNVELVSIIYMKGFV